MLRGANAGARICCASHHPSTVILRVIVEALNRWIGRLFHSAYVDQTVAELLGSQPAAAVLIDVSAPKARRREAEQRLQRFQDAIAAGVDRRRPRGASQPMSRYCGRSRMCSAGGLAPDGVTADRPARRGSDAALEAITAARAVARERVWNWAGAPSAMRRDLGLVWLASTSIRSS